MPKRHLAPVCTNDVKSEFVSEFMEARLSLDATLVCTAKKEKKKKRKQQQQQQQQQNVRC